MTSKPTNPASQTHPISIPTTSLGEAEPLVLSPLAHWQRKDSLEKEVHGYIRAPKQQLPTQLADANKSPRLHFLHGTGFSAMTMAPLASLLPSTWELWLTDVPGHGLSEQPNHRMPDWPALATSIAETMSEAADVENNGPMIGVGHSMGGVVTLLAAVKYPQLFSRIILLDPVLFNTEIIIAQHLMRTLGVWKKSALVRSVSRRKSTWPSVNSMLAELKQKQLYRLWHDDAMTAFGTYAATVNKDNTVSLRCDPKWEGSIFGSYPKGLWHAVHKVAIPVDILVAKKSYSFIPKAAKKAARINNNIRLHTFGEHHCFPMEQPYEAAAFIESLISESI